MIFMMVVLFPCYSAIPILTSGLLHSLVITHDRTKYNGTQLEMNIFALRIVIANLRGVVSRNSIDHEK